MTATTWTWTALHSVALALALASSAAAQQVGVEFRDRVEGFSGAGFTSGRDDAYDLTRLKIDVSAQPASAAAFKIELQDARPFDKEVGPTGAPFKDVFNLHLAYADLGSGPVSVRLGRQELSFGDERLVGSAGWLNAPRSFDAARATIHRGALQFDAFAGSVVKVSDRVFADTSGHGSAFAGAYASTTALVPHATTQAYFLWKTDRGGVNVPTVGTRWTGALARDWDYATEIVAENHGFGAHQRLRRTLGTSLHVRVFGEYNYASLNFDPLYQTGHDKYGLADQIAWKNLHHVRSTVELAPKKSVTISSSYHSWWRADSSTHIGQELDAQAAVVVTSTVRIVTGIAHIFPGAFLQATTPGAAYTYPFLGVTCTVVAR